MTELYEISPEKTAFYEKLWSRICSFENGSDSVFLYPHKRADMDAYGASCALALICEKMGKNAYVLTSEDIGPKFDFLPELRRLCLTVNNDGSDHRELASLNFGKHTVAIAVDSPGGERIGERDRLFRKSEFIFVIDHHIGGSAYKAEKLIDSSYASSSEIVAEFILYIERMYMPEILDYKMAELLFCGIITDTGRFMYSNTNARTLKISSELLRFPLETSKYAERLFDAISKAKLSLMGFCFSNAKFFFGGKMIFSFVPYEFSMKISAIDSDFEGISSELRNVDGVDIAVFIKEHEDGELSVSLRSSEDYDVQKIAAELGGGGHIRASGFSLHNISEKEALKKIIETVKKLKIFGDQTE